MHTPPSNQGDDDKNKPDRITPSCKSSCSSLLPSVWRSNPSPLHLQALPTTPSLFCPLALSTMLDWPLVLLDPPATLLPLPQGLCTCLSSAWNTLSHIPSIHSHLVISIASKYHLLREACPDCPSWSAPPLVPFAVAATILFVICLGDYLTHICCSS